MISGSGVVALCSRGLIHSRTMESIEATFGLLRVEWPILFTHDRPIPEAQNEIVDRALRRNPEWILFVEEDIALPDELLMRFKQDLPVQTVDYSLPGGSHSVNRDRAGRVMFCGLGCLLVKASVFGVLDRPFFKTTSFTFDEGGRLRMLSEPKTYGGQDIYFCDNLARHGFEIHALPSLECKHFRVRSLGQADSNNGCHEVIQL